LDFKNKFLFEFILNGVTFSVNNNESD